MTIIAPVTLSDSVTSSLQHLQLINERRAKLDEKTRETRSQLMHAVYREWNAGVIALADLPDIYLKVADVVGWDLVNADGKRRPSMHQEWVKAGLPDPSVEAWLFREKDSWAELMIREILSRDEWVGEWPTPVQYIEPSEVQGNRGIRDIDSQIRWESYPKVPVVYILFDESYSPVYCGSSGDLRSRLRQHEKNKVFKYWRAYRAGTRAAAYAKENVFLQSWMPPLNKKAWA